MKENNSPKVTIVTVTYNAEQYLEQTIKSVIEQDYPNIEYIIIDGGSTDKTVDIIKKYEKHLTYWISEPDSGIYDAMNKGIDAATGEWIQFLNAGDTLCSTTTIKKVSKFLIKENDLVHGLMWRNKPSRELKAPLPINERHNGSFIWHPTLFTKTYIMKQNKFDSSFKIAGDYNFFLKCVDLKYTIKFIEIAIVDYLENGVSQSNNLHSFIEVLFAQTKYLNVDKICSSKIFQLLFSQYLPNKNLLFNTSLNQFNQEVNVVLLNKKFILYGFGHAGQLVYEKHKNQILFVVDINYKELNENHNMNIVSLEELKENTEEYIFISVMGREDEISSILIDEYNFNSKNILSVKL